MTGSKVIFGRDRRRRIGGGVAICASLAMLLSACWIAPAAASDTLSGPHVFGWGFNSPASVSSDGSHVWVANGIGNSVTELNAATGALVQVISGSKYKFKHPVAVSSDGSHVWVTNRDGDSVTELAAATGALVQVISGSRYGFGLPQAISSDGTDVWVANADQSITGFPA
jgi:DNA-binding beta-propeller fold protein YncE